MTQSKRIFLNTIATYGRSMFGVLCGVFSTRWVLEALGQVDFGLYGLIASLVIFISFLNIQFSSAIARYYAFSIGEAMVAQDATLSLRECRAWFSTAVFIHTIGPVLLVSIGYPVGLYAIGHDWLNIPFDKVGSCRQLWGFVCLSTFVAMANVPFTAMYTAKQYIAELTIYSFLQTVLKTAIIYYMACHPGNWLVQYGFYMAIVAIVPQIIIAIRAFKVFPECRLVTSALFCKWRMFKLGGFAFWQGVGGIGYVAAHQMLSIVVTKFYGPRINAAFSVSQTVSGEAASLTGALQGAFAPAITTACGSGDQQTMREMAFRVCKVGTLLTLMFALPMMVEIDELLRLWLKNPPPHSAGMCVCTLIFIVVEKLTCGHITAVNATGRVAHFQALRGFLRTLVIPLALIPIVFHLGVVPMMFALPISALIVDVGDVWLARSIVGMGIRRWLFHIVLPLLALVAIELPLGCCPRLWMEASFLRIVFTTTLILVTMIPLSWLLLDELERNFFRQRLRRWL